MATSRFVIKRDTSKKMDVLQFISNISSRLMKRLYLKQVLKYYRNTGIRLHNR